MAEKDDPVQSKLHIVREKKENLVSPAPEPEPVPVRFQMDLFLLYEDI